MPAIAWLDGALGTAAKVRILRALARQPDRSFREADLAKLIDMSPNTVNLALRELTAMGIVQRTPRGRSNPAKLNTKSPMGIAMRALYRSESDLAERLGKAIRKVVPPGLTCVLFGSAARGDPIQPADIDLLIVASTLAAAAEASVHVGQAARAVFPAKYRIIHMTPGMLRRRRNTPLVASIRREGQTLAGPPLEAIT